MAFVKYFIFLRILRHYKVIALALGAPGVGAGGRPAGADWGPRDARTVRHYKVIGRTL